MTTDSRTCPDDQIAGLQDSLYDPRSGISAPRQIYAAVLALTNGRPFIGSTTTEDDSGAQRLSWKVFGVVDRAILLVRATGPDDNDTWEGRPLDVQDITADLYPSSILTNISSRAEFSPRYRGERVFFTRYTAHLGPFGDHDVDAATGEALLNLLQSRHDG